MFTTESSWLKQKNELTSNQEIKRLYDYATGKLSRMVSESQGRPVSVTRISPCEWRHLKTCAKFLSRRVSQLLCDSSFTMWVQPQCVSATFGNHFAKNDVNVKTGRNDLNTLLVFHTIFVFAVDKKNKIPLTLCTETALLCKITWNMKHEKPVSRTMRNIAKNSLHTCCVFHFMSVSSSFRDKCVVNFRLMSHEQ